MRTSGPRAIACSASFGSLRAFGFLLCPNKAMFEETPTPIHTAAPQRASRVIIVIQYIHIRILYTIKTAHDSNSNRKATTKAKAKDRNHCAGHTHTALRLDYIWKYENVRVCVWGCIKQSSSFYRSITGARAVRHSMPVVFVYVSYILTYTFKLYPRREKYLTLWVGALVWILLHYK